MSADVLHFDLSPDELPYDAAIILGGLGYPGPCPEHVAETLETLRLEAVGHMHIQAGYAWVTEGIVVQRDHVDAGGRTFACGPRISRHLSDSRALAVFAATLGPDFDAWSHAFFKDKDPYQGYLADALGSAYADHAADWLQERIGQDAATRGQRHTNRVSPGYCGWSVGDQQTLFALLPPGFCGIRLTDSSLMIPIKSVTGVIGLGPDVSLRDYACQMCDQHDCIMRRHRLKRTS